MRQYELPPRHLSISGSLHIDPYLLKKLYEMGDFSSLIVLTARSDSDGGDEDMVHGTAAIMIGLPRKFEGSERRGRRPIVRSR